MKSNYPMRRWGVFLLCLGMLLCLISLGLVQSSAVEKVVQYAIANPLLKGTSVGPGPMKLARDNSLSGMHSRPASLKDKPKTKDDQNPFIAAIEKQRKSSTEPSFKPDEILVKFKPFTSSAASQSILSSMGMKALKHYKQVDVHLTKTAPGMKIEDANETLELGLPEGPYETVAGFVLDLLGHIPKEGEQIKYNKLKMVITEIKGVKIEKVLVTKEKDAAITPDIQPR